MVKADAQTVLVLSGPNLNLLGQRQPEIYGTDSLDDHMQRVVQTAQHLGLQIEIISAQGVAELVTAVHSARGRCAAIIINPGALTHFAWSLHDALASFAGPIVEVHLSNPATRETWRHESVVAPVASGSIAGFGADSYVFAVHAIATLLAKKK
ncbi:MAG: 3-dehydroquinate dehydratase [Actinobacteria bacterium]|nr:3-dehydroquinate dehydratase [Actinomycetota bacterium]